MNTKTQPAASEPSSLNELAEVWSKAMTEYRELLARAGADAEKFRVENDMFGWNFHKGLESGAIEMHLILCKVEKAIAALLSSDAKLASKETTNAINQALDIKTGSYICLACKCSTHYSHGTVDDKVTPCPNGFKKGNSFRLK